MTTPLQVDKFGSDMAFAFNAELEFHRNVERYAFLRWGQEALNNFKDVPPDTGNCHQVKLEYLARVVFDAPSDGKTFAFPVSLVGKDSHTTMINALGVFGWGVGGIEAEAAMLGQPLSLLIPEVVGLGSTGGCPRARPPRTWCSLLPRCCARRASSENSLSSTARRPFQLEPPDPRDHCKHGPRIRRHHGILPPWTQRHWRICALQAGMPHAFAWSRNTPKAQRIFTTDATPDPIYTDKLN